MWPLPLAWTTRAVSGCGPRSFASTGPTMKSKQITVAFLDGKALKGELTGVDTYELFVKQSNGLEIMSRKGAIKYLHPAAEE
jgi:sRNA-binding regulator protein Hfq